MKIFEDSGLIKEVMGDVLHFDIVQAGDTKEKTYYVKNDTYANVKNLVFTLVPIETKPTDNVEIVKAPTELKPQEVGELVIKWDASVELKQALKIALSIKGQELYG